MCFPNIQQFHFLKKHITQEFPAENNIIFSSLINIRVTEAVIEANIIIIMLSR